MEGRLTPYIFFGGNCAEAMKFYQSALGGTLEVMTFGQTQGESCPTELKDKVMHASLRAPGLLLMASDDPTGQFEEKSTESTKVALSLNCVSLEEIERVFGALSSGGRVKQPLQDMFWGDRFGMLTDRYGFHWMISHQLPKK